MSNIAQSSNKMQIEKCPLDLAIWRLLVAITQVVSLEWRGQKPDKSGLKSQQGVEELQIGYTDNSVERFGYKEEQGNKGVARKGCWVKGGL